MVKSELISRIKDILMNNPVGLNVTEISKKLNISRNTAGRYLDSFLVSGQVDMKSIGSVKIYTLSSRVPISAMLDYSFDLIILLDKEGKIIQANDVTLNYFKIEKDAILGKKITDTRLSILINKELMLKIHDVAEGEAISDELISSIDGQDIYFKLKLIPTLFAIGSQGVTIILEDISKQKYYEKVIKESKERLSNFMDSATDGFLIFDSKLNLIEANKSAEALLEINTEVVRGKNILEVIPIAKETGRYDNYLEVIKTGQPFARFDINAHPILGELYFNLKAFKVLDGLGIIITNITDRIQLKRLKKQVKREVPRFSLSPEGMILDIDAKTLKILNYEEEELIGKPIKKIYAPESPLSLNELLEKWKRNGELNGEKIILLTKDGATVSVLFSASTQK